MPFGKLKILHLMPFLLSTLSEEAFIEPARPIIAMPKE